MRLLLFIFLLSCEPFEGFRGVKKVDINAPSSPSQRGPQESQDPPGETEEERQARLAAEKTSEWKRIVEDANLGFSQLQPMLSYKCFDCHDSSRRLRLYARVFPSINPLYKHQQDGLKALDLKDGFPFKIKTKEDVDFNNVNFQLSLLNSFKNSFLDRSMPLKSYRLIYRRRRIFNRDESRVLNWVDSLINELEIFKNKYSEDSPRARAYNIFEAKCTRCHGYGVAKGGFGDMEKTEELLKSKYINLEDPEASSLYQIVLSGEMPTNERERLTEKELADVLEWIQSAAP